MNITLLDTNRKTSSSGLLSFVFCGNNKLVLASPSLLSIQFQSEEMDNSLLDVRGILPQRVQHKHSQGDPSKEIESSERMPMCQILDTLIRLLCWRPLCTETTYHAAWSFLKLPYNETKFNVHNLLSLMRMLVTIL